MTVIDSYDRFDARTVALRPWDPTSLYYASSPEDWQWETGYFWDEYLKNGYYYGSGTYGFLTTQDAANVAGGGTVTARTEWHWSEADQTWYWHFKITGLSIALETFVQVANSASQLDDRALLEAALGGNDSFYLSDFDDWASGLGGNDFMRGYLGNDVLNGGTGHDELVGDGGRDVLTGGAGNDTLWAGAGKDRLIGGRDADLFVFEHPYDSALRPAAADVIEDFERGKDKIDLRPLYHNTDLPEGGAFVFVGTTGFGTSALGEVRYRKINAEGTANDYTMIYIDTDNDRAAELAIRLTGLHNLSATDFLLG